jgi:16S rRNA (guanine966-N2)-methyltransferase
MRIIAGVHRGRKIEAPEGLTTRPMIDRVRENLFNLLGETVAGAVVLDLFCGSGALGLEALSRGAARVTFVDADREAVQAVETNCRRLGLQERVRILRRNALRPGPWMRPEGAASYTLIFVDPPYKMTADVAGQACLAEMAAALVRLGCIVPGSIVTLRAKRGVKPGLPWPGFEVFDERSYGTTTLYLMVYRGGAVGCERTE